MKTLDSGFDQQIFSYLYVLDSVGKTYYDEIDVECLVNDLLEDYKHFVSKKKESTNKDLTEEDKLYFTSGVYQDLFNRLTYFEKLEETNKNWN